MAIHNISLNDCLEPVSPPEKLLTIGVVDDTAFVRINQVRHDGNTETQTASEEIAVSLASLREALELLSNDRCREGLRPVEPDGGRAARLTGHRVGIVPT
jgi:hypothetical protein